MALFLAPGQVARADDAALILAEGSIARDQMVAIGQDLQVHGHAMSHAAAIDGSVLVTGRVDGDVIVLGGKVELDPGAVVQGDVFVLGGTLKAAPGAEIHGQSVSYPEVSEAWMTLLEGPSLGRRAADPLVLAAKLALLCGWMATALLCFAGAGREVLATSEAVRRDPIRHFAIGFVAVLLLLLLALFFSTFAAALVGLPFLFLCALFAVLLKLWGMVAVFSAVGQRLVARWPRRVLPLTQATLGIFLLGTIKFLPLVGLWIWWVATFIGVGAALSTKFGRLAPWVPEPV